MRPITVFTLITLSACSQESMHGISHTGGHAETSDGAAPIEAGVLTAGEWNDHDNWEYWLELLQDDSANHGDTVADWGLDLTSRVSVHLKDDGGPLVDEHVLIRDANGTLLYQSRTNVDGHAQLFPQLRSNVSGPFSVYIGQENQSPALDDLVFPIVDPIELHAAANPPEEILDLMFVIDTTCSMGDELSYLQTELADVISISRQELVGKTDLRLSVNFYRDEGDEYVVRPFAFTEDVPSALEQLHQQDYGGGGDWPEAVESALFNAVHQHQWSDSARARLLFLVLDAPPDHNDSVVSTLQDLIVTSAAKGVQIIPVASSGIDTETEFLLRSIDIATNGTYVFLTDDSGIGNEHQEPTVGQYAVEPLNELLVRLITEAVNPDSVEF